MNRLAQRILRLYPWSWRKRYGNELQALIQDTGADARIVVDLLKGAVRMQFSTWSFPRLAAVLGLAGIAIGAGISLLAPAAYTARTVLPLVDVDSPIATLNQIQAGITSPLLSGIVRNPRLEFFADELHHAPLEDVIEEVRRSLSIRLADGKPSVEITFTCPDKATAKEVLHSVIEAAVTVLGRLVDGGNSKDSFALRIVDMASFPPHPLPLPAWMILLIVLAGALAGLLLALFCGKFIQRRRSVLTLMPIACAAAGFGAAWFLPEIANALPEGTLPLRYESHGSVLLDDVAAVPLAAVLANVSSRESMAQVNDALQRRLAAPNVGYIPRNSSTSPVYDFSLDWKNQQNPEALVPREYTKNPKRLPEDAAELLRRNVRIAVSSAGVNKRLIDIWFAASGPSSAQLVVSEVISNFDEDLEHRLGPNPQPHSGMRWGRIDYGSAPADTLESVTPHGAGPVLAGFGWGVVLAAIIATLRTKWTAEEQQPLEFHFDSIRFRKLATWLTVAGIVAGLVVARRYPATYTSDATISLENVSPESASRLVAEAVDRELTRRDENFPDRIRQQMTVHQLPESETKNTAIGIGFTAADPQFARQFLNSVLAQMDTAGAAQKLRIVDNPQLPVDADGPGGSAIAYGAAVGPLLAALLTLLTSFRTPSPGFSQGLSTP